MIITKRNKIILEPHEKQFIKDNFYTMKNQEIADALGLRLTKLRGFAYEMGLKRMELEYWTNEQVQFLKDHYKTKGDTELAEIFEVKWFKEKGWTKKHIEKKRRYLKLKRTSSQKRKIKIRNTLMGRFKECAIKRWESTGQTPIGEKRVWFQDDRPFVVNKKKNGFVHYNQWLYEQHKGEIPSGMVVRNMSDKLLDVTIEDLEVITRAEHAKINSQSRTPEHLRQIKSLIKQLNKEILKSQN